MNRVYEETLRICVSYVVLSCNVLRTPALQYNIQYMTKLASVSYNIYMHAATHSMVAAVHGGLL